MQPSALIVIDVQKGLDDPRLGRRNNPQAEANIARLIATWRERDMPIVHVQHCSVESNSSLRPELPGNDFKDEARPLPGEPHFKKTVNSAFIGTGLEDYLRERAIDSLVMIGLTTDHCVSTSVRMAANLGFEVTLIDDATAAFERRGSNGTYFTAQQMHEVNVASLKDEFCTVRSTDDVLEDLEPR